MKVLIISILAVLAVSCSDSSLRRERGEQPVQKRIVAAVGITSKLRVY